MKEDRKRKSSLRLQDPFLKREKEKYKKPLPSREWIISVLEQHGVPLSLSNLERALSISEKEQKIFSFRIAAMIRDGQIHINRRGGICVAEKIDLIKCTVAGHKDGYGFAIPIDNDSEDFRLTEKQMRSLIHGDVIIVRPKGGYIKKGQQAVHIVEVLERNTTQLVCRLSWQHGIAIAVPENKKIAHSIVLPKVAKKEIRDGQVVSVKILSYPTESTPIIGEITETIGHYEDSGIEIEIALRKHDLPHIFSKECVNACKKISDKLHTNDYKNRKDLRDLPFVTIDGEDSRDFDDAVYVEKQGRNFRLLVAIADVAHYVKADSAIDKDARERLTSVYFPRRVIPMLPEKLSNGICSLNPNEDRLAMVCDMQISSFGNIKEYSFYPATINSHARLTYTEVWNNLETGTAFALQKEINNLYSLFKVLLKKRNLRGAMDFESTETHMIFNKNGKIEKIEPYIRNDAHRIIEECMLAANVCAADFLQKHKHPALYRIHEAPNESKLETLREQLSLLGLSLPAKANIEPKDFAKIIEAISQRPDKNMIQVMLLRSMNQAVYSPENKGHFGLAYDAYTHFTSPIRRYPDLLVHRAIKAILQDKKYHEKSWQHLADKCSYTERRADDASNEVERWLKTYYMKDKIGETFFGTVSGMTNFGLFVTIDNIYIDGMIHISDLGQDYFNYRPEIMAIEGERTRIRYSLGDRLKVRVVRADLDTCRIDFLLEDNLNKTTNKNNKNKKQHIKRSRKK